MTKEASLEAVNSVLSKEVRKLQEELKAADKTNMALTARVEELEGVLTRYREAVRIDVTMEGPKFMGSNASALKRAWDADRAALTKGESNG